MDVERQQAIRAAVADTDEVAALRALAGSAPSSPLETPDADSELPQPSEPEQAPDVPRESVVPEGEYPVEQDVVAAAFELGRFQIVVDRFLQEQNVINADAAVQAVLELGPISDAGSVLEIVKGWLAEESLVASRRLARDIADLERLVDGTCAGWPEWAARLSAKARWADAGAVLRDQVDSWTPLESLAAGQIDDVADGVLSAVGGANEDQLRFCLDVLCRTAATVVSNPACAEFCEVVLQVLGDQDNVSEPVRSAYLDLLGALLESGPSFAGYRAILDQTSSCGSASHPRTQIDWAIGVVETALDAACPDPDRRNTLGIEIIEDARRLYGRLNVRQRVEFEVMAPEFGLLSQTIDKDQADDGQSVWRAVDGTLVGLYSLMARAASQLEERLRRLCTPQEVRGNDDLVATGALRNLAGRADDSIVDTWHAAHQATRAIDDVRPRELQILPKQRGVSGFIRALEDTLAR